MLSSKYSRHRGFCLVIIGAMVVMSCRPSEPAPTYNEDLGTGETVLLPTMSAWYDPAVAKGQADWRPFRKPSAEAKSDASATGDAKSAGGKESIESELRTLVDDFNAAVTENKLDEAIDVLVEDQVAPAKQAVEVLPTYLSKVREVVELLPGVNETLKTTVAGTTLSSILKLEVVSITVSNPTEAVGKVASAPGAVGDARFVLVKETEGEYWYIDHPQVRALSVALPALQQSLPQLDAFIAGVKSGQISGEALAQQATMINQMIGQMLPPVSPSDAEPTKGEPEKDAKPEEESGG